MLPKQLKETTMDPSSRTLKRIIIPKSDEKSTISFVDNLMGKKPEERLKFIKENAENYSEIDI